MFDINFNSNVPIFKQIKENIKHAISLGIIKEDEKLPSIQALSSEIKVAPKTIQKAYFELELENIVYTKRGLGTFASKLNKENRNFTKNLVKEKIEEIINIYKTYNIDLNELKNLFIKILEENNGK
jgi:DNA-binding transcriptional regulator YhcF (GntR family)